VLRGLPTDRIAFHPPVSNAESGQLQVQADLLFLPLSFDCEFPELIRTSAPGKFGEYLASGTPVLVHAPADSFPVTFVRQHRCAAACSVANVGTLAETLATMLLDAQARDAQAQRGVAAAEDFSESLNRERFCRLVTQRQAEAA
jgi:glycosyltransferase involved in cell wall biosynthesis